VPAVGARGPSGGAGPGPGFQARGPLRPGPTRLSKDPLMPKTPSPPASFEAALTELETIVASMEGGQVPLKEALESYRRGAEILRYCQATLKDAQLEIAVLEKGVLKAFKAEGDQD
jgi:exodeoxyribonuclease VII small subunit